MTNNRSYLEARRRFLEVAQEAGAEVTHHVQPGVWGAEGEELAVDVALTGPGSSQGVAIVIVGTHGAEGHAGSDIVTNWLAARGTQDGAGTARLLIVHAVSPWSFSHATRATENNVDLNRNFRLTWQQRPNGAYARLLPFLHNATIDASECLKDWRAYSAYLDRHGRHLEVEMVSGQSDHPEGLYYSGTAPEWANRNFRHILQRHTQGAKHIGFLDIHTGLGEYGDLSYLVFSKAATVQHAQSLRWWGLDEQRSAPFATGALPAYEGLLCGAIVQECAPAFVAGAVIEFGTCDRYGMFRSDRLDRWLRFEGRADPDASALRAEYLAACSPVDVSWRRWAVREGISAIDRLVAGVGAWT